MGTDVHTGRCHARVKTEIKITLLQAKEGQDGQQTAEAGREAWDRFSALRRNQPCQHLDLGLLATRSGRQ